MTAQDRTSATCLVLCVAAWVGNALYALGAAGGALKYWSPALVASAMIAFLIIHGSRCYGRAHVLRFVGTVFLIGWSFETLSVVSGFPFGNYHYTDVMQPFLGHVPISVMPAYCVMGYVSWAMALVLLNRCSPWPGAWAKFAVPVAAAALMVIWDLSMDPLRATVEQRWIWADGGPHLGVPIGNYFGWALVTWIMFQCFMHALPRKAETAGAAAGVDAPHLFWLCVPLMYAAFAVEYILNPFVAGGGADLLAAQDSTARGVVYSAVAVIAATTMLPLAALAALMVRRAHGAAGAASECRGDGRNDASETASA